MSSVDEVLFLEEDLQPRRFKFNHDGKRYLVTEASAGAAREYKNACFKATKLSAGKVSSLEGMADVEPLLVSLCTFEVPATGDPIPVSRETVNGWQHRMTQKIYDKIKEVSDLSDPTGEEGLVKEIARLEKKLEKVRADKAGGPAKNAPKATAASSS